MCGCVRDWIPFPAYAYLSEAMGIPVLGTQLLACLAKRVAMVPDPAERAVAKRRFLAWLESKRAAAGEQYVREAWGLHVEDGN